MKKILSLCVLIIALCKVTFADALNVVPGTEASTFKVVYTSEKTCNTRMVIRDADGNRIFSEMIRNQCSFIRPYNFTQLPYGEYTITASNEFSEKVTKINHQPEPEKTVSFQVVSLKDNKYILLIPDAGVSKLRVKISTQEGVVYTKIIKISGDYACKYAMKGISETDSINFELNYIP